VKIPETYQTSNIYVPGLSRAGIHGSQATAPGSPAGIPELHSESRNAYTDREVSLLPYPGESHPRNREWAVRAKTCRRLIRYLSDHKKAASILDIGCGNGWLSHQLATVPGSRVVGLDSNLNELRQAARVFRRQSNLKFIYGDFYSSVLQDLSFDIIVLAATIQHFPSTSGIIGDASAYLRIGGELHILDSHLYRPALQGFPHRYLYDPHSLWNRISSRRGASFPWVCISKT
jgi:protein-L-isoaspartate O-methyltransferase